MADKTLIAGIKDELALDQARLEQACGRRAHLANDVHRGVNVVAMGINLREEIQGLSTRIFRNKRFLASAR